MRIGTVSPVGEGYPNHFLHVVALGVTSKRRHFLVSCFSQMLSVTLHVFQ